MTLQELRLLISEACSAHAAIRTEHDRQLARRGLQRALKAADELFKPRPELAKSLEEEAIKAARKEQERKTAADDQWHATGTPVPYKDPHWDIDR